MFRFLPRPILAALWLLLAALGCVGPAMAQAPGGGLLPVTQAFELRAKVAAPGRIHLHWDIAQYYYLYRGRIHVKVLGEAITPGTLQLPPGQAEHDPFLGDVVIYHDSVDATLPYTLAGADARQVTLEVQFQGCHEVDPKICYPPHTQTVTLTLPSAATAAASGSGTSGNGGAGSGLGDNMGPFAHAQAQAALDTAAAAPTAATGAAGNGAGQDLSAVQKIALGLDSNGRWLVLLGFFVAGLALSFTPCVLPMIPILSGLIAGAGAGQRLSTPRAFTLSLVYVLASSVVFVIAGVVAGLIGASVQAAFQSSWLLTAFAVLFVLLALSMFGFYELKLPTALQNRLTAASNKQHGGSLTGVAVMGVLSALIVGPCVAPPLAGAVLYIAQSHDPVFGALALFLLSLGMGVPLIVFGMAAGRWLPHAGPWMRTVQAVFGVLFLALAIWMVSRFLDPLWIMLMTGMLLIGSAVYLGALDRLTHESGPWPRLWKACGLVLLVLGVAQLVGLSAGSRSLLQPLSGLRGNIAATTAAPTFRRIKSVTDLQQALASAQAAGQPVMLDFYADWCVSCKEMEHFTYTDPAVAAAMSRFVLLKADVTANDDADRALLKHFDLFGPPATIFYAADGGEIRRLRLVGFEKASAFLTRLDQAEQG